MNRSLFLLASLAVVASASAQTGTPFWGTHAGTPQHRAQTLVATQNLNATHWATVVDSHPQYQSGGELLIHYGTPLITHNNVICVPLKTGTTDGWAVRGFNASTGTLIYTMVSDYSIASYTGLDWTPEFGPALSPDGRLYVPGAGGTIMVRDNPESAFSTSSRLCFYGLANYNFQKATYNAGIKICTPLTIDAFGNIYFGFITFGGTMDRTKIGNAGVISGLARVTPGGIGTWKPVTAITGDSTATHIQFNCAPAITSDGTMLYVAIKKSGGGGYLVGVDPTTLTTRARRKLLDPSTGNDAGVIDQSSATPMIGTDGDVYFGVIGNPHIEHHLRGYMLHFDKTLITQKPTGSFGWDNTASLIPAVAVPSYSGTSPYLLLTKYNNYWEGNGDGVNRIAVLDPNKTQTDFISGLPVMKEVMLVTGVTPDSDNVLVNFPNAVREWCVNTAVIDVSTHSALLNSEDGTLYRWSFATNTLTQSHVLGIPLGEAYTPTISGPTGLVYGINNATLFCVGN